MIDRQNDFEEVEMIESEKPNDLKKKYGGN
jgi:hypothetical protein